MTSKCNGKNNKIDIAMISNLNVNIIFRTIRIDNMNNK